MTTKKSATGIRLTDEERRSLLDLAAQFECVSKRGPGAEEPSIRALLADIAGGELVLRRARPGRPHQAHKTATSRVRAALAEDPTLGPTELAQIAGCSVGHASKIKGAL